MTNKEQEMFEILRANPAISQSDLAKRMGITRSSASVHISNLLKKGYLRGRGYILNEPGYVSIIGAANIDIVGRTSAPLMMEDSNPGSIEMCAGGVGRNVAENLARLGVSVKMISAIGDDAFGRQVVELSEAAGVDMSHCHIQRGGRTSTYLAILNDDGEMHIALSDMHILDGISVEHFAKKQQLIANSDIIVIDAGLVETAVEYILANFASNRIFLDSVSIGKAKHVKPYIGAFDTLKANRMEAEFLSDIPITDDESLKKVGAYFLKKGVRRVFISLGRRGMYYCTATEEDICPTLPIQPVNPTGAGDALMAGIVYGTLQDMNCREISLLGGAMSRIALLSEATVSPLMSLDNVQREIEKQKIGGTKNAEV